MYWDPAALKVSIPVAAAASKFHRLLSGAMSSTFRRLRHRSQAFSLVAHSPLMTSDRNTKALFNSKFFGLPPDFLFGSRQESGDLAKGASPSNRIAHKEEVLWAPGTVRKHHHLPHFDRVYPRNPYAKPIELVPGLFP